LAGFFLEPGALLISLPVCALLITTSSYRGEHPSLLCQNHGQIRQLSFSLEQELPAFSSWPSSLDEPSDLPMTV
jgi:hypothetical protein